MRALAPWTGLLVAGALLAGCDRPVSAPAPAAAPTPPPSLGPAPRLDGPEPSPDASADPPSLALALPGLSWPRGLVLRRSGTLGGSVAPAAWYELGVENAGAVDAARRVLDVLSDAAGPGALSDLAPAADGKSAIGQVRGPRLSAVVAASSEGSGATVRVTLEPLR